MSYLNSIIYKSQRRLFKSIITGKHAWQIFNDTGIEGFGTNLLRLYFPVYYDKKKVRDSFGEDVKKQFSIIFDAAAEKYSFDEEIRSIAPRLLHLPLKEENNTLPYLDNYFFGLLDATILGAMLQKFKPAKVIEIGSGISSRYIRYFKNSYSLSTELFCIDPAPRADIGQVADIIVKEPLEAVIDDWNFDLKSGDIVFMDGSHYTFQGNDTLTFFFKLLPLLPAGIVIHVHDVYLPFDYPENVAPQLWTEQYLLAAMLLAGFTGYEVIYPAYYASQTNDVIKQTLAEADAALKKQVFKQRDKHTEGYSFWFRKL